MEKLMQYVWQHRLIPAAGLRTVDGRRISVINPGLLNNASGPDFFNASIEIDGTRWMGNVEIHVRASDWHRHGHDGDDAYDSVILHVVDVDDMPVRRRDGSVIPQMRMPCSTSLNSSYHRLTDAAPAELSCGSLLAALPALYLTDWLTSLAFERLYAKTDRVYSVLASTSGNWEETAYITLARALGFGVNSEPMERLARSLPLRFLRKHADSETSIEALMFGHAGFLETASDSYTSTLQSEYRFLAGKFGIRRLDSPGWKLSGMRPQSFPYRRIALLARMICSGTSVMSAILDADGLDALRRFFCLELSQFWQTHYTFGGHAVAPNPSIGGASADILVINCAVPLLHAYATYIGDTRREEMAIELLHQLKGERNRLVTMFSDVGVKIDSAFISQALIQLRREYCEKRKCLYCRIGHRLLATKALRE